MNIRSAGLTGERKVSQDQDANYLAQPSTLRSWLLPVDHKRVAILYLVGVTAFFLVGGLLALLMRAEMLTPESSLFSADIYNRIFTMHGLIMVFLFLLPALPGVLGNFLVPMMVGARNVAFPRLNAAGWYAYMLGGFLLLTAALRGGVDTTWTFLPPFATTQSTGNILWATLGIAAASLALVALSVNFIVTIHKMRAPGMRWTNLPVFVWAQYCSSVIVTLVTPVLIFLMFLVIFERLLGSGLLNPAQGGEPLLFKRLFWLYARPVLYASILPAIGVITEIITAYSGRPIAGYRYVVGSLVAISVLSFLAAGNHMFSTAPSLMVGLFFSFISFLLALPFVTIMAHWIMTLYRGRISLRSPFLYAAAFLLLLLFGGLTGLFLAAAGLNISLHGTLFVVAHFHYLLAGGVIAAYLGGLHFWWPKVTGRSYSEGLATGSAVILFVGLNLTFLPLFFLGSLGMPRRQPAYPAEFEVLNVMSSAGVTILAIGYLLPIVYLLWAAWKGTETDGDQDTGFGLEWTTASPPPTDNFPRPSALGTKVSL